MKGYNEKALKEAGHTKPNKPVDGPTRYTQPEYGNKIQYAENDTSPLLSDKIIKRIQKLTGKFLYKGHTVDNTTLHALNKISVAAIGATIETMKDLEHFLDYCSTHPEAEIIYQASDMQLMIDSDAAYLVAPKARNRVAGYHYLGNKDGKLFNGPIYILAKVIKAVTASAAEAECG